MKHSLQPTLSFFYACLFITLLLPGLSNPLVAQMRITDVPSTSAINANAVLELASNSKALLLPRLTNTQIQAMQNVPAGMLVYSSTDNVLYIRTNSAWVTLAQAANAASVTNPFSTINGTTIIYTNASKIGIGTSNPNSQLANNAGNTVGSDGQGGNAGSLSWAASQVGYVGQIYNSGTGDSNNGLVVKVNSMTATAFDVSQGSQSGNATSLLLVKSDGKVGINNANPAVALDINGDIKASVIRADQFKLQMQYIPTDVSLNGNTYSEIKVGCPTGTQLIGGGGGHRDSNSAIYDINIRYSGPDFTDTSTVWRMLVTNSSSSARAFRVYIICGRVF